MLLSLKMNLSHACVNPSRMPETFQDHGCEALDVNDVYYTMNVPCMIYMDAEYKHWLFELTSAIFWKVATAPWSNAVWLIWELEQYFQWYKKWEQHKYLNIENDRPELEQCLYPGPRGHSLGNSPGASGRPPSCSQWSPGHRRVVGGSGNFSRCRIA